MRLEVSDPSILKTERPPRYSKYVSWLAQPLQLAPSLCAERTPAQAGSFFSAKLTINFLKNRAHIALLQTVAAQSSGEIACVIRTVLPPLRPAGPGLRPLADAACNS